MEAARHWRLNDQRYRLVGEVCNNCDVKIFPPRDVCPGQTYQTEKEHKTDSFTFSGKGVIYSYTTIYDAPTGFESYVPYTAALVKLDEGPLVTAQLTDIDDDKITIDMPVEMVTRKLYSEGDEGMIVYGYKFRPKIEEAVKR